MNRIDIEKNEKGSRFALYANDVYVGEMTYIADGDDRMLIDHTYVKPEFEGKGFAKELFIFACKFARKESKKIVPVCSYVRMAFKRYPEYSDLLDQ